MYYIVSNMHAPYNLGMIASFINVLMYGAPAAELPGIWRTGNTDSMPFGLSFATFMCSVFWWLYGLELADPFLIWPNVLGMAFGGIQLFTIYRFSSGAAESTKSAEGSRSHDDNADQCADSGGPQLLTLETLEKIQLLNSSVAQDSQEVQIELCDIYDQNANASHDLEVTSQHCTRTRSASGKTTSSTTSSRGTSPRSPTTQSPTILC